MRRTALLTGGKVGSVGLGRRCRLDEGEPCIAFGSAMRQTNKSVAFCVMKRGLSIRVGREGRVGEVTSGGGGGAGSFLRTIPMKTHNLL